jgi:hypothetical protein
VKRQGFSLVGDHVDQGSVSAYFTPSLAHQGRRTYSYIVTRDGRRLKGGKFTVVVRHHRRIPANQPRRIWQDTDPDGFWTYCINGNERIYSEGGVLYCDVWFEMPHDARPGFTDARVSGLR